MSRYFCFHCGSGEVDCVRESWTSLAHHDDPTPTTFRKIRDNAETFCNACGHGGIFWMSVGDRTNGDVFEKEAA
jgi:hypothetical protein